MDSAKTDLSKLGEFGLIEHLTKDVKIYNKTTEKGIGDDAAILDYKDKKTVVTTDLLLEGIHFDLIYCPLKHLGYKAVIVNISDIYAMNAIPQQITVSIGVSNKVSLEHLDELYNGIKLACERYKVDFVGGDTSASVTGLTISVTAIGIGDTDKIALRNSAKPNDLILVSGDLGAAYMGLQLLEREKAFFQEKQDSQPDLSKYDYILERQLKPEARNDVIKFLNENKFAPTSMIDISDGLSSELLHLCKQSGTGCKIYEEKIPLDAQTIAISEEFGIDPSVSALNGGDDYELLFTLPVTDHEKIKNLLVPANLSIIGYMTDKAEGTNLIGKNGSPIKLEAQGWNAIQ